MSQGAEWGDNGTTAAGWSHTVGENGITEGLQWGSETSWNTVVSKGKVSLGIILYVSILFIFVLFIGQRYFCR